MFADYFVFYCGKTPASPDPSGSTKLFMTYDKLVYNPPLSFNGRISTETKKEERNLTLQDLQLSLLQVLHSLASHQQ
ncbi:MAG: hypothetical protein PWQ51_2557 [Methanolobus sp.]|jgi:hypothetical protein|nr:hypothetical protein [Methanolobus sp.]